MQNAHELSVVLCLLAGTLVAMNADPVIPLPVEGSIEELGTPLVLDGSLDEWQAIAPVHLGKKAHLPVISTWPGPAPQPWQGPDDASMLLYLAWTPAGLAVAGDVVDGGVTKRMVAKDSVTLICFPGEKPEGAAPDDTDLVLTLSPPVDGIPSLRLTGRTDVPPEAILRGGALSPRGYLFEMLIPWDVLPLVKPLPGATLSLQFSLRAHGRVLQRNGSQDHPIWRRRFLPFRVVDQKKDPVPRDLSLYAWFEVSCPCCHDALTVRLETSSALAAKAAAVRVSITRTNGECLMEGQFSLTNGVAGRDLWLSPPLNVPVADIPDEGCDVAAIFVDSEGRTVGSARYGSAAVSLAAKRLVTSAAARVEAADLRQLSERDPFKAAAWFGVISSLEWVRRCSELHHTLPDNTELLTRAMSELRARLAVLEGRSVADAAPLEGLLALTGNPEAQVVVAFDRPRSGPHRKRGSVSLDWGSLPLMAAQAEECSTPGEALRTASGFRTARAQKVALDSHTDAYFTTLPYWRLSEWRDYVPEKEVLLTLSPRQTGALPISALDEMGVEPVAFFPQCPGAISREVTAWAKRSGKRVVSPSTLKPGARAICVGVPDDSETGRRLRKTVLIRHAVSRETGVLRFAQGSLVFNLPCLSLESGLLFARTILARQPVTLEQADRIRQAVVRALPRKPGDLTLPAGMDLYVGDVHTHTLHSDGTPSPLGLAAEAFCNHLDFCVISDHHCHRNGAATLIPLLNSCRLHYDIIPGTEITEHGKWGHANVYPLRDNEGSFAARPFNTLEQSVLFSKDQNRAVLQWSHPDDWRYTCMDYLMEDGLGPARLGIEAWEGYPPRYQQWKTAGQLPVLTGGSDTHYGGFANPVRTVILAPSPSGASLAAAIRSRACGMVDPYDGAVAQVYWEQIHIPRMNSGEDRYVYGDDAMIQMVVDALAEAGYLKERKKRLIRGALEDFRWAVTDL